MADPYADEPYPDETATPPQGQTLTLGVPEAPIVDRDRAEGFMRQHRDRSKAAGLDYESLIRQRQDAIEKVRSTLDQTIQQMRDKQVGGPGQMDPKYLALASGLLSSTPGVKGNFSTELGRGLGAMAPIVQQQRLSETDFLKGIAQLQAKQGELADVPLKDAATMLQRRQLEEDKGAAGIERGLITSKADRPYALGSTGIIVDPATGKAFDAITKEPVELDPNKQAVDGAGKSLIGSGTHGDDFLKSIPSPTMRTAVKGLGDYDTPMPSMGRNPQSMQYMQNLFAMAKQYNPDFDVKNYATIQKGMKDWTGSGKMAMAANSAGTVTGHLQNLQESAAGLNNADFRKFNNVANWIQANKGDPRVQAFEADRNAVIGELTKFLTGGEGAEATKERWLKTLDQASSPEQLQAAIKGFVSIMHTQLDTLARNKSDAIKKSVTAEDILSGGRKDAPDVIKNILNTDISTPGGRLAALRRRENSELKLQGLEPKAAPSPQEWEKQSAILKKNPSPQMRKFFDEAFGDGSSKLVLGR